MRCGLARAKTADTVLYCSQKFSIRTFSPTSYVRVKPSFSEHGTRGVKAAAARQVNTRTCSGFNAPCPVPSLDFYLLMSSITARNGGALFAPPLTRTFFGQWSHLVLYSGRTFPLQARGAALNEAMMLNPRATQRAPHEGSGPNDITTDYAASEAMRKVTPARGGTLHNHALCREGRRGCDAVGNWRGTCWDAATKKERLRKQRHLHAP